MKRIWILLAVTALCFRTQANEVLLSPDGQTQIGFRLTEYGAPQYSVLQDGDTIIRWSSMGMICLEEDLQSAFTLSNITFNEHQETWETVWGEERTIEDHHREMDVELTSQRGITMHILFRVFNDGFAFRYAFPEASVDSLTIIDECTEYRFVKDHEA